MDSERWIEVAQVSVGCQLCGLGVCCGLALFEVSNRRNVICLNHKAFYENQHLPIHTNGDRKWNQDYF